MFLFSCTDRETVSLLNDVETYIQDRPDSALTVLQTMDSVRLGSAALRTRYSLLYAMALDKNDRDDGQYLSEMKDAVKWYERHGSKRNKMLAYYYLADQLADAGNTGMAVLYFTLAGELAEKSEDWFYCGLAYRGLADVFGASFCHPEEIRSLTKAVECFERADKPRHAAFARIQLGGAYSDNYETAMADSIFNVVIASSLNSHDSLQMITALANSAGLFMKKSPLQPDSTLQRLLRAEQWGRMLTGTDYGRMAWAADRTGDTERAEGYLRRAYSLASSEREHVDVVYFDYLIKKHNDDSAGAYPLLEQVQTYIDSVAFSALEQSYVRVQRDYFKDSKDTLIRERNISRQLLVLLALLALTIIVIVLLVFKIFQNAYRKELQAKQTEIDTYIAAADEIHRHLQTISSREKVPFDLGIRMLDSVSDAYYSAPGSTKPDKMLAAFRNAVEKFRSDDTFISQFERSVDKLNDGIITKLKKELPDLKPDMHNLFLYLVAGFSYSTISVIMDNALKANLYNRRRRLIQAIEESHSESKELFLSYLPNRTAFPKQDF